MVGRLILAMVVASGIAAAQGGRGGGGGGDDLGGGMGTGMGGSRGGGEMEGMSGGGMRMPQRQTRFEQFVDRLKLSKEQLEEAQKAFLAAAEAMGPMRQQLNQARVNIAGAIIEGKSADDIKKLQDAYAGVCAQMTAEQAKAFAKVYAALKPNQQAKAPQAFELIAGLYDHPAAGGGSGRRGR